MRMMMRSIECGKDAKDEFSFDAVNYNHGSYGAVPNSIRQLQRAYQDSSETRPDFFIRYEFPRAALKSREAVARYLGVRRADVVYVPNTSSGINLVLRNIVFKPGDVALYFSTIYSGIESTLRYVSELSPLTLHAIPVEHPASDATIVSQFRSGIRELREAGKRPRIAVFDTISSKPGVRNPFEALTEVCREEGVLSCIDAAHSVGHIPLDLKALDPDFFVSNLHKWLYVPRPCAIMYVPERNQDLMRSNFPTSYYFVTKDGHRPPPGPLTPAADFSDFELAFDYWSVLDSSAYLVVPDAIAWRDRLTWNGLVGEDAAFGYCAAQARQAGALVSSVLGTDVMENEEGTLGNCNFTNVRLPLKYTELFGGDGAPGEAVDPKKVAAVSQYVEKLIVEEHNTFIMTMFLAGSWWSRLSAQVYLDLDDWKRAAEILNGVCRRAREQQW